jgi:hypothetical protein
VLWHYRSVAVTQRVGSPLQFVQRVPVAGAELGSPLSFVRQLPVVRWAWTSTTGQGPRDLDHELKPPNKTAPAGLTGSRHSTGCVIASLGYARARGIACGIQSFCITPIQAALNDF